VQDCWIEMLAFWWPKISVGLRKKGEKMVRSVRSSEEGVKGFYPPRDCGGRSGLYMLVANSKKRKFGKEKGVEWVTSGRKEHIKGGGWRKGSLIKGKGLWWGENEKKMGGF